MSSRTWIIFVAVCVVLFGGLVIWSGRDRVDVSKVDTNKTQSAAKDSGNIADHVFGNEDAKVILVEYGDFQCPGCGSAYPVVKALSEKYKDQLGFVFRNFPLTNIHPNARAAAAAAEVAGKEGKYWEMHNILYENQSEWSEVSSNQRGTFFATYAGTIGLDKSKFSDALNGDTTLVNKKINFDIALGRKLNVDGTPTFYLNGKKLSEDQYNSQEAFEKTLKAEFKKQNVTLPDDTATTSN